MFRAEEDLLFHYNLSREQIAESNSEVFSKFGLNCEVFFNATSI